LIILIAGASHTGKTLLAQKLLEKYKYPYLSIDHLKMGVIRSGYTHLTPEDDKELTDYLWPVIREMMKTAIENDQNLIIEGCYIPLDWEKDFSEDYLDHIRFYCLIMTEAYIKKHFSDIKRHADAIEKRLNDEECTLESLLEDNAGYLDFARAYPEDIVWIDEMYEIDKDTFI
jgi:adenylate kinase family enzyme